MVSEEEHTTWVGNIWKKVGTLYSGIDSVISEDLLQYAETQFLTAGANVRQFTENQFFTAGANVKQFCSEFMQEVLPESLKDSLLEKIQSEDTERCDSSSCEILKKEDDEGRKDELSKSNSCGGISAPGFPLVEKEMNLEQNHIEVTSEPEDSKVDSLTLHHYAFDECKILENVALSSGIALSKASNDSTDGHGDAKADQIIDNHTSERAMNSPEPFNMQTMDQDCSMLSCNNICSASDLQVKDLPPQAMDNFPLKEKFEKGWEFIQMAGYEDHQVASAEPQPRDPKSNKDHESFESDWEMV